MQPAPHAIGATAPIAFRATHSDLLPIYKTSHATGADVCARVDTVVAPFKTTKVPTGVFIDHGHPAMASYMQHKTLYDVQLRLRSSWALRGLIQPNAPATIDLDYRDEICVLLFNPKNLDFHITRGTRIAQLVISLAFRGANLPVSLDERVGGFGSTDGGSGHG
jgi:dUTP pyrophosphatase